MINGELNVLHYTERTSNLWKWMASPFEIRYLKQRYVIIHAFTMSHYVKALNSKHTIVFTTMIGGEVWIFSNFQPSLAE